MRLAIAAVFLGTVGTVGPATADVPRGAWMTPPQVTTEIAGARVTLAADRGLAGPSDRVRVTVSATKSVAVHLIVMRFLRAGEDHGELRVVADERRIARPAASTATFELGAGAPRGELQRYQIVVAADGERVGSTYMLHVGQDVAMVPVVVWTGDTLGLDVDAPTRVTPTGAFTVTLRVRNPTARPIEPRVQLGTTLDGYDDPIDVYVDDDGPIAARSTRAYKFTITPRGRLADPFAIVASALVFRDGATEDDEPTLVRGAVTARVIPVR